MAFSSDQASEHSLFSSQFWFSTLPDPRKFLPPVTPNSHSRKGLVGVSLQPWSLALTTILCRLLQNPQPKMSSWYLPMCLLDLCWLSLHIVVWGYSILSFHQWWHLDFSFLFLLLFSGIYYGKRERNCLFSAVSRTEANSFLDDTLCLSCPSASHKYVASAVVQQCPIQLVWWWKCCIYVLSAIDSRQSRVPAEHLKCG